MMCFMRTTLTLDTDVALRIKQDAARTRKPMKQLINEALREGLSVLETRLGTAKKYRTRPHPLGLRAGLNYDSAAELLARGEREDFS